jgi:amino acid adenylation domain-containing protein
VDDLGKRFKLTAQVDQRLNPGRITGYMGAALRSLVSALEESPQTPALELSILPESERQQLVAFNATHASYPTDKSIHQLFEEQAQRLPTSIAVRFGAQALTYAELDAKANQLARYLRTLGVGPDRLVGLCIERSLEMVIGLLAVLKAGGAYVPLDPNYPPERLRYMLQDAAPEAVLTQECLKATLADIQVPLISLPEKLQELAGSSCEPLPVGEQTPQHLVYVIYTSGSTGRPKGTAMPHAAMVNLVHWHRTALRPGAGRRVLQFAALSFDVAFQEIFSTLCTGGTLVLLNEWVRRDPGALAQLLQEVAIQRLFVPPLMLQSLAEHFKTTGDTVSRLEEVITAGEQLRVSPEIVGFFERHPDCRLHNHYGPTETHVVTALSLAGAPHEWPLLPAIGRPIANTQIHILNEKRQPVPVGAPGEIYIGGLGLARGYVGRPELTAQRFIDAPIEADGERRLYRTGDVGRWRQDGVIEYLGRNDDQVKIRGFRIELGEIEAQLGLHADVKEAAVVVRDDARGEKRLVAYVTRRGESHPGAEELRAHLKERLPEHMLPGAFVLLDSLPLTPSGKLNRRALPAPQLDAYVTREYAAPVGRTEQELVRIWQELLQVSPIGRLDNFFELGGHSLHGMKLVVRVEGALGVRLPVAAVFQYPTIQRMADEILARMLAAGMPLDLDEDASGIEFEEGIIDDTPAAASA